MEKVNDDDVKQTVNTPIFELCYTLKTKLRRFDAHRDGKLSVGYALILNQIESICLSLFAAIKIRSELRNSSQSQFGKRWRMLKIFGF